MFELGRILAVIIGIGVYGGITVITVELLGAFCETTISLPPIKWILIGGAIAIFLLVVGCGIVYATRILGTACLASETDIIAFFTTLCRGEKVRGEQKADDDDSTSPIRGFDRLHWSTILNPYEL